MQTSIAIRNFATLAALLAALVLPASASAAKNQRTVIEDPARSHSWNPAVRTAALDDAKALGAHTFKIAVLWRDYAPSPTATTRPAGDLTNPDSYPAGVWDALDQNVAGAQARGMQVWLTLTAPAPRWAVKREGGNYIGNYLPNVDDYADFVRAVGKRYPHVKIFSFWNEPNIRRFIDPQTQSGVVKSAVHYRKMYAAAYESMRRTGHSKHTLLFGELMPRTPTKKDRNTTRPVAFLRAFFCLDSKGRKMKGKTASRHSCSKFKKIKASGLAYHPYRLSGGPLDKDKISKDNAPVNYLARIYRVLDAAYKQKRLATKKMKIYNSEFGYQTNPPDIFAGTAMSRVASYLNIAEYLTWTDPRVATYSQYLIIDDAELGGFQTGLKFNDGTPKTSVMDAFNTPMVVMRTRSKNRVSVWGGVRAKPSSTVKVSVQYQSGSTWKTGRTVSAKGTHAYFSTTVAVSGASTKNWRLSWDGGTSRKSRPINAPKPRKD